VRALERGVGVAAVDHAAGVHRAGRRRVGVGTAECEYYRRSRGNEAVPRAHCPSLLHRPPFGGMADYAVMRMTRSMPSTVCSRPSWVFMKQASTQ